MVAPNIGFAPANVPITTLPSFVESKLDNVNWNILSKYLLALNTSLSRELSNRIRKDNVFSEIQLVSPSGKVYSLTVSDTGVLSTTLVYG